MLLFRIPPQIKSRIGGKGFVYIMDIIMFIRFVADGFLFLFGFKRMYLCILHLLNLYQKVSHFLSK